MKCSSLIAIAVACILCVVGCKNLFKKEPICVLQAWMIKDNSTGVMVATNMSPFTFDTTAITILSLEQCNNCPLRNNYKVTPTQAVLDQQEITEIDSLCKSAIGQYNIRLAEDQKIYRSIDLTKLYKYQYIAVSLVNGEKEIWVNAFCSNNPDWKNRVIQVEDGGSCYFSLLINLTNKSTGSLRVNGEG